MLIKKNMVMSHDSFQKNQFLFAIRINSLARIGCYVYAFNAEKNQFTILGSRNRTTPSLEFSVA